MQVIICAKHGPKTLGAAVTGRNTRGATYARQGAQKARQQAHRTSGAQKGAAPRWFPQQGLYAVLAHRAWNVLTRARPCAPAPVRIRACGVSRVRGKN